MQFDFMLISTPNCSSLVPLQKVDVIKIEVINYKYFFLTNFYSKVFKEFIIDYSNQDPVRIHTEPHYMLLVLLCDTSQSWEFCKTFNNSYQLISYADNLYLVLNRHFLINGLKLLKEAVGDICLEFFALKGSFSVFSR